MRPSSYDTRFSVVCLPENTSLFMMNMQVFEIRPSQPPHSEVPGEPQAIVWCAVFQRPAIKKL